MAVNQRGGPDSARPPGRWLLAAKARQDGKCHLNEPRPHVAIAPRDRRQCAPPRLREAVRSARTRQTCRLRARVACRCVDRHRHRPANQSSAGALGDPRQAASMTSSALPYLRYEPHRRALCMLDHGRTARLLLIILSAVRQAGQPQHRQLFLR